MPRKKYRKFSPEFRDEAVRLVVETSRPIAQVAREPINMLIEARRLVHGYRNFENYRLRMLLAASGNRTRRVKTKSPSTTLKSEEPDWPRR